MSSLINHDAKFSEKQISDLLDQIKSLDIQFFTEHLLTGSHSDVTIQMPGMGTGSICVCFTGSGGFAGTG